MSANRPVVPLPTRDDPAQERVREWFLGLGSAMWLPLITSASAEGASITVYTALAPTSYRTTAMTGPSWDLHIGNGRPSFSQRADEKGGWITTYDRYPRDVVEPLVYVRQFHGVRPNYCEISEEFRLFHDLVADAATGELLKIDDAGNTIVAAHVAPYDVRVLTALVRQYQAARQLDLLLFIDSTIDFDPSLHAPDNQEWITDTLNASLSAGDLGPGRPFSRFLATRVLPPPPREDCGVWPYEREDTYYPEFIIGTTDIGEPVRFSCNPDNLANLFGGNAGAPLYLTPVHFRREVLAKYYGRPELYRVHDGYLRCGGLWGLRMDNDGPDTVVAWLGDLGRDLPASERDYWRSFNVAPARPISKSAYRRQILAQFADADAVDLRFRAAYVELREAWVHRYGWPLYRDPEPGDAHLLDVVRRPLHDTELELEELVRTLTKLLVDFLNEAELVRGLPPGPDGEKGISKFERWLKSERYRHIDRDIALLKDLQAVRSQGVAHGKGSKYEKTRDRVFGSRRPAAAGEQLLDQCLVLVHDLTAFTQTRPPAAP